MLLNDCEVVWPKAAWAPVSGVEMPNLIGPGGIGGKLVVAAAVVAVPPAAPPAVVAVDAVDFFDELPQAAVRAVHAVSTATVLRRIRIKFPLDPCQRRGAVPSIGHNTSAAAERKAAGGRRSFRTEHE